MKSNQVLAWALLAGVGLLGACGGISPIGSGDDPMGGTAGKKSSGTGGTGMGEGATGNVGKGAESTGATSMGASANMGGTGSGGDGGMGNVAAVGGTGMGAAPGMEMCANDMDCVNYGAPCEPCADGSYACNRTYCAAGGYCVHTRDTCTTQCKNDMECPQPSCKDCGDGTVSCPTTQCLMGRCETTVAACGNEGVSCVDKECGAMCTTACKPGEMCNQSAIGGYCNAQGQCQQDVPQCSKDPDKCESAMDCGTPPPNCVMCGNDTCAGFECIEHKCVFACPPNPEPQCEKVQDCPVVGDVCIHCQAVDKCAVQACVKGSCEMVCPVP